MEKYLGFFYEIAEIPHGSGNTRYISDYLVHFAKTRGLYVRQDEAGNVVIIKAAHPSREGSAPVILQGHMDMVAVKEPESTKDMEKEGLELYEDGELLRAMETSLGGDDGIAVAYMLALLDGDYVTPRLECIFTVDEETGMLGASAFSAEDITGKRMINIDQEEEGIFIAGCAGGVRAKLKIPTDKHVYGGPYYEIKLTGLKGGHSGIDIDKNRGNAISVLSKELCKLNEKTAFNLIEINGGYADNAIPSEAAAKIMLTETSDNPLFIKEIMKLDGEELFFGLPGDTDEAKLSVTKFKEDYMIAMDSVSTSRVLDTISEIPCGVIAMSEADPRFVETSANIGIVCTNEEDVLLDISVRSSMEISKKAVTDGIIKLAVRQGAEASLSGDYPGWAYAESSPLRDSMTEIYEKMFGKKPEVKAIHAGLECGIFIDKLPGLECVSIGPDIKEIHTYNEALSLPSAKRVFDYIVEVLSCI